MILPPFLLSSVVGRVVLGFSDDSLHMREQAIALSQVPNGFGN